MVARYCVECGNLVTTAFCPSCGAIQPALPVAEAEQPPEGTPPPLSQWRSAEAGDPTGRLFDSNEPYSDEGPPAGPVVRESAGGPAPAAAEPEQPWHPFEQPSWYPEYADPRTSSQPTTQFYRPPLSDPGPDFMGISQWETEPPPASTDQRRNWILGGLAALAVVAVLVAVAFLVIRSNRSSTPDSGGGAASVVTSVSSSALPTSAPTASAETTAAPAVTVTVTGSETSDPVPTTSSEVTSDPATSGSTTPAVDPMGGPVQDIPCGPAYIVQIASGVDDASFVARVAELRAAGQLPANVFVAHTQASCAIFSSQTNTTVLYAGPFADRYAGCEARLAGAPDSFIKGTTPETAKEYVSCLCPAQVITVPQITAVGQTGVWVGELQRVLANKLNFQIPDLAANWGTFTQSTSDAVKAFQTEKGLPQSGQVDVTTWQALQAAQCGFPGPDAPLSGKPSVADRPELISGSAPRIRGR